MEQKAEDLHEPFDITRPRSPANQMRKKKTVIKDLLVRKNSDCIKENGEKK